jgi:hypothetical protein
MLTTLTPSEPKIGKVCQRVAAALRKSGIEDDRLQPALEVPGTELEDTILAAVIKFVNKVSPGFDVWKTLSLGTCKDAEALGQAIKGADSQISDWSGDIMSKPAFTVSPEQTTIDLVKVSVAELGFPKGATRAQIYERGTELGLELCPPEVGPQLRLQYSDQPRNEWLLIAMEPITVSVGDPRIFRVARDDGGRRWLNSRWDRPGYSWGPGIVWVFSRRKS